MRRTCIAAGPSESYCTDPSVYLSVCLTAGQLGVTFLDDDDEHETTHTAADKVNTSLAPSSLLYQTYVSRHDYYEREASIE